MADPKIISASKIAFYRGCPLAYYFNYLYTDKEGKRIKVPTSAPVAFGTVMHYMTDQFYNKKKDGEIVKGVPKWKDVDACLGTWKYNWMKVMKEQKCRNQDVKFISDGEKWKYYWLGVDILKGFYQKMAKTPWPAETEKSYTTELNGEKIMAKIDRLDLREDNGEVEHIITDYKTDRASPERSTFLLNRSPQFTLYSYIYEKLFGKNPSIILLHLRSGKGFKTRRNKDDYEYLEAIVDNVANGIRKDIFVPFFGFHCNMCNYKEYPCRESGIGVDGKLKALEKAMKTSPEIADWISFDVKKPANNFFDKILKNSKERWVREALEKIFADYITMERTIEEIGMDSLEFISAMQSPQE